MLPWSGVAPVKLDCLCWEAIDSARPLTPHALPWQLTSEIGSCRPQADMGDNSQHLPYSYNC
jgi:hypothetical protein